MKREYFAVDDYGQGGVWVAIHAESAEAIQQMYPELHVYSEPPDFLARDVVDRVRAKRSFDLDDPPSGYLVDIIAERS